MTRADEPATRADEPAVMAVGEPGIKSVTS